MLDAEAEAEVMEGVEFFKRVPKLMQILDAVCAVYVVRKLDVMSMRRNPAFVVPREAFYWCAYYFTSRTHAEIGRFLGGRDHTTIIAGVSRINRKFCRHRELLVEVALRLGLSESDVPETAYGKPPRRFA